MKEVKPIVPDEIQNIKDSTIPDEIVLAVNELIVRNWDGNKATFKQKELAEEYLKLIGSDDKEPLKELYARKQMDFEPMFRKIGWYVEYDKPGYNESYDAYFVISKRK